MNLSERTFGEKECVWCGKKFVARSPKQTECKDAHYRPCSVCGEPLLIKESYANYMKYGPRCHAECKGKKLSEFQNSRSAEDISKSISKSKKTCMERYGVENVMQSSDIQEKAKATVKAKYGVDNLSQSSEIQSRIRENSISKYGVSHYSQAPEIRQHMIDGMIEKYGDSCAQRIESVREQTKQTNLERYGTEHVFQSEKFKDLYHQHSLDKFGTYWPMQNESVRSRSSNTLLDSLLSEGNLSPQYLQFREDPEKYILDKYSELPRADELSHDLNADVTCIYDILSKHNCRHLLSDKKVNSRLELAISEHILSIAPDTRIIHNDRTVISPKEIDIYLPDYNIGIECNPTVTHNSSFVDPWGQQPKSPSYHKHKSEAAEKCGIRLFHVFGYDWSTRPDVVLSTIQTMLGKSTRYYARNTYVCELTDKECKEFLSKNHQKGAGTFKHRYGLRLKATDELLSVMTFNKMRKTIGLQDDSYELSRFCNRAGTSVVGGASKLFKHFLNEMPEVKSILSYSDIAHTSGKLYSTLGFVEEVRSDPNYVWVDTYTDVPVNRVNAQKSNIQKFLHDDTIDLTKTEKQIMEDHNYAQVFDCGTIRWRYTR